MLYLSGPHFILTPVKHDTITASSGMARWVGRKGDIVTLRGNQPCVGPQVGRRLLRSRAEGWEAPLGPVEESGFVCRGHEALLNSGQEDSVTCLPNGEQCGGGESKGVIEGIIRGHAGDSTEQRHEDRKEDRVGECLEKVCYVGS